MTISSCVGSTSCGTNADDRVTRIRCVPPPNVAVPRNSTRRGASRRRGSRPRSNSFEAPNHVSPRSRDSLRCCLMRFGSARRNLGISRRSAPGARIHFYPAARQPVSSRLMIVSEAFLFHRRIYRTS